jgi:hypothetical protein
MVLYREDISGIDEHQKLAIQSDLLFSGFVIANSMAIALNNKIRSIHIGVMDL